MGSSIATSPRFAIDIDRSLLKINVYDKLNPTSELRSILTPTVPDELFTVDKKNRIKPRADDTPDYETYEMYIYSGDEGDFEELMKQIETELGMEQRLDDQIAITSSE